MGTGENNARQKKKKGGGGSVKSLFHEEIARCTCC